MRGLNKTSLMVDSFGYYSICLDQLLIHEFTFNEFIVIKISMLKIKRRNIGKDKTNETRSKLEFRITVLICKTFKFSFFFKI